MRKILVLVCVEVYLLIGAVSFSFGQFTILHHFAGSPDGWQTWSSLVSDGTFLFGMSQNGGVNNYGTVFKVKKDSSNYAHVLDLASTTTGSGPDGSLYYDGTYLYGMTPTGGAYSKGTIFKIKPDGTGYLKLLDFDGATTGANPHGTLYSDGVYLYGPAPYGGTNNYGTIFKIKPDGTGFVKLLDLTYSNGTFSNCSFISDNTFLYGVASDGCNSAGDVYKIKPDGSGFTALHCFSGTPDGNFPMGSLLFDGTYLYGTTQSGGTSNKGIIYKVKPDGTGYLKLLDFTGIANGSSPQSSLINDGTYLYGAAAGGGTYNYGAIYKIKPDGSGYMKLFEFDGTTHGGTPHAALYSEGSFLYGTTQFGGNYNNGIIYRYELNCDTPSAQASNITFSNVTSNSVTVSWTNGTGSRRVIKIKPTNTFAAPANGNDYNANSVYSGSGEQIVYNGIGNSVSVTGLLSNTHYWFRVYEASCNGVNSFYRNNPATGNPRKVFTQPYQNPNRPENFENNKGADVDIFPNPFTDVLVIKGSISITLFDYTGKEIIHQKTVGASATLNTEGIAAGLYFLRVEDEGRVSNYKVVKLKP